MIWRLIDGHFCEDAQGRDGSTLPNQKKHCTKLKIIGNIIDKIGGRTSNVLIGIKNSGVFNQFFSDVKEIKDELFFYNASKLISKCILLNIAKLINI